MAVGYKRCAVSVNRSTGRQVLVAKLDQITISQEYIAVGCVPPAPYHIGGGGLCPKGVSVQGSLCPGGLCSRWYLFREVSVQRGSLPGIPPPCEQNLRQVLKHYLSATSFVDCKNSVKLKTGRNCTCTCFVT